MTTADTTPEIAPEIITRAPATVQLRTNPVVLKELRGRMRGARAFIVMSVYLLLMTAFSSVLYLILSGSRDTIGGAGGTIGRNLFIGIVCVEFFLVSFIAPSFTASAISGERENQTYDLLRTTLLPSRSLVVGKMLSALAYIFLLLLAAVPLQSIAFLFGGVTEVEVILAFVILGATALLLGSAGLYASAKRERTIHANIATYGVTLALVVGLPLLTGILGLIAVQVLNTPWFGGLPTSTQSILVVIGWVVLSLNPVTAGALTQFLLIRDQAVWSYNLTLTTTSGVTTLPLVTPWIIFTVMAVIASLVLMRMSVRAVDKIDQQ